MAATVYSPKNKVDALFATFAELEHYGHAYFNMSQQSRTDVARKLRYNADIYRSLMNHPVYRKHLRATIKSNKRTTGRRNVKS